VLPNPPSPRIVSVFNVSVATSSPVSTLTPLSSSTLVWPSVVSACSIAGLTFCKKASDFSAPISSLILSASSKLAAQLEPINNRPNPYVAVDGWANLPDGREWGSTAGVDIDPDGRHLWAIDRCGSNSCAGSDLDPIVKIDPDGNVVTAIGGGLMLFPHGLHVDRDGNIWVTDAQGPDPSNPATAGKGHVVYKLSPEGEVLLTLGQPGLAGDFYGHFYVGYLDFALDCVWPGVCCAVG